RSCMPPADSSLTHAPAWLQCTICRHAGMSRARTQEVFRRNRYVRSPGRTGAARRRNRIRTTRLAMMTLARFPLGRILLHLLAMLGDRCVHFHVAGIMREIAPLAPALAPLARMRAFD